MAKKKEAAPGKNKQKELLEHIDETIAQSGYIKKREEQAEEVQNLFDEKRRAFALEEHSLESMAAFEPEGTEEQEELTKLLEVKALAAFLLELKEDLHNLKTPTSDLIQAIKKSATKQEEVDLLYKKILLLKDENKGALSADSLFSIIYQTLKEHGVEKRTLKESLKNMQLPPLKSLENPSSKEGSSEEMKKSMSFVFPFEVLGFNKGHDIMISHKGELKSLSLSEIRQGALKLYVGTRTEKTEEQLSATLLELAKQEGTVDDQDTIKTGVDYLKKSDRFLVVSGKTFFKVDPSTCGIEKISKPVVDGRLIEGDRHKNWISMGQVKKADLKKTFSVLHEYVKQWNWRDENMALFMTAFLMIYPFHKIMDYRPWLYLLGESQSGKTTFIEDALMFLYGKLVVKMDKGTAHSTAQEIGNTSLIPVFDEFEKFRRMGEILELFKMTTSKGGGVKKSGTPGKEPFRFTILQIPLFASIYTPPSIKSDYAQDNRTIKFELIVQDKANRKAPITLTNQEKDGLVGDILSSVMMHWKEISKKTTEIDNEKREMITKSQWQISGRTVDNFKYSIALIRLASEEHKTIGIPEWSYTQDEKDDGDRVLSDLLHTRINHEGREHLTVDLIYDAMNDKENDSLHILRLNGITTAKKKGEQTVAFCSNEIKRTMLKQDDYYKTLYIGDVLERIPGAKRNVPTFFGSNDTRRSTHVPFSVIEKLARGSIEGSKEKAEESIVPTKEAPPEIKKEMPEEKSNVITDPLKHYGVSVDYITSQSKARLVFNKLLETEKVIAIDIETYPKKKEYGKRAGLDPHITEIRLVQCYFGGDEIYVFDLKHIPLKSFPNVFWRKPLVCHNALFELQHLIERGLRPKQVGCTLLMEHVLIGKPMSFGLSLKSLCQKYLNIDLSKEQQVSDWSADELSKEQVDYAAIDSLVTFKLVEILLPLLQKENKLDSYGLKRDAQFSIAKMKVTGLPINKEKHETLINGWTTQREESSNRLKEQLGETNPNSSKQLNAWLEKNVDKKTLENWKRTKTGAYQTSGDVLKYHKANLPWWEAHRDFKKVDKRLNNYGQKMINLKSPVTKRLHSDIFIAGTDTGRLSSANPNCQNFPREAEFREIFEAPEGKKLIVADYSQVELRVAAIVAQDKTMLEAYRNGEDLHRKTAAFVAGIKEEEVTKEERQKAKAVNFGFLFGMGAERFVDYARDSYGVALTLDDSHRARKRFFDTYQGIKNWHYKARKEVEKSQRTRTPMGFVRYFDKEKTALWKIQNEALNTPVQGGAAEATLKALHHIGESLEWSKAQIINCIHDEIIIESDESYVEKASQILENGMIQGFLDVFPGATTSRKPCRGRGW